MVKKILEKVFKRSVILALFLLLLLLLSACDTAEPTPTPFAPATVQTKSPAAPTLTPVPTEEPETFTFSGLSNTQLVFPTSLMFGPDGRLYVAQRNGQLFAYTMTRHSPNNYSVVHTEQIDLIRSIPNHNDDGSPHSAKDRQLTGFDVVGTAGNPILYVTSSDYREGGGSDGQDYGLDTNSGVVSMLTCKDGVTVPNGCAQWEKIDLVRGLPRSEQNHSTNGIQLIPAENKLYVAQGGFTDTGAPSRALGFTGETALSAAILQIDLDLIMALPTQTDAYGTDYKYNLPTLNSVNTPLGEHTYADPWGGNDGLNQAVYLPESPVQLFATGFRNPFDLLLTEAGNLYTVDNGSNFNWGGYPEYEESYGCTNNHLDGDPGSNSPGPNPADYPPTLTLHDGENGTVRSDGRPDEPALNLAGLHLLRQGYYAGHANPTRGNPAGAGIYLHDNASDQGEWLAPDDPRLPPAWPPFPIGLANPIECDFQGPMVDDGSIANLGPSTNGLTEYTASNLNQSMKGVILGTSYTSDIFQVRLNETGDATLNCPADLLQPCNDSFARGFGSVPLDIFAIGDDGPFPGTIWVTNHLGHNITVFEPVDYTQDQPVNLPASPSASPTKEPKVEAAKTEEAKTEEAKTEEPEDEAMRESVSGDGEVITCINAGGPEYIASDGRIFLADQADSQKATAGELSESLVDIENTADDVIFQTERWGAFKYFISLPEPGLYTLELYFAEIHYGVNVENGENARSFNVHVEHSPVLNGYDIGAVAGGSAKAIIERFKTTSYDATLTVEFIVGDVDNPKVSALCVLRTMSDK
ncbi:MAG: glucose/arabinose dehydrogenase [Cellvibrionaceae bacterium]|jgi:glucose/arabinose dehydrogenase